MAFYKSKIPRSPNKKGLSEQTADGADNRGYTEDLAHLRHETLRWIFSIAGAVAVFSVVAAIILKVYHPDIDALVSASARLLVIGGRPEPVEALLFRSAIIILPATMLGFYVYLPKGKPGGSTSTRTIYFIISILVLLAVAAIFYFDFSAINPFGPDSGELPQNDRDLTAHTNFDFYFEGLFLGRYLWVYTLLIVPLMATLFFIGLKKYKWDDKGWFKKTASATGYIFVAATIVAIVVMNTFNFPYTNSNQVDLNAVYYSMTQVYSGAPLLVNNFTNTYGLYPHFLNPLFQLTGLSVLKFSFVMSALLGLSFVLNFFFLRRMVHNKVLLFLGATSILFFPYLDFKLTTIFDCIFSLYPIRYIIPSSLAFLAAVYFYKPSKKIYWLAFFVAGTFILWNPEIGLVCYLSWLLANIYSDFYDSAGKADLKKMIRHVIVAVLVLLVVFYTYKLLIYVFYSSSPDLSALFGVMSHFENSGVGLLPMSPVHPWNIMAVVLMASILFSIAKWHQKKITPKTSVIVFITLVAVGYFFYFQGRSHNSNFSLVSGFWLMLLIILADELWDIIRTRSLFFLNAVFVMVLFIVSFSFVETAFSSDKIIALIYQDEDKAIHPAEQSNVESNQNFINANSEPFEKIHLITPRKFQGLYFDGNKRLSAFNPGMVELFLNSDLKRMENVMRDSSFSIFIEPTNNMYKFLDRPIAAAAASYQFSRVNKSMALLKKSVIKNPVDTFFGSTDQLVVHRKYNSDTTGINTRIDDAAGMGQLTLNPSFSVEALFYSTVQIFKNATLLSNQSDSNGFFIANVFNSSNYFFGINKKALVLPLAYNEWTYLVMNVYPDRIEIFKNGTLLGADKLTETMRSSTGKFCIGNISTFHYYTGPISEVAVFNKILDTTQVQNTWRKIANAVMSN